MKKVLSADFRFRLGAEREAKGWTQITFAAKVVERSGEPMNQSRVSLLENGRADPSLFEVEILALGLGVTPGFLAFGERQEARQGLDEYEVAEPLPMSVMEKRESQAVRKAKAKRRGR